MRALQTQDDEAFEAFEREEGPMLRRALASRFGPHDGGEAYAEAMAYAWEHWSRLSAMANPAGYLYRVGGGGGGRVSSANWTSPPTTRPWSTCWTSSTG
jgi:hypothetical protein